MRGFRQAAFALILWVFVAWLSTTYARPVFPDCYPRANWDGRYFVLTGEWRCLGR
jgi:hypothetical protein